MVNGLEYITWRPRGLGDGGNGGLINGDVYISNNPIGDDTTATGITKVATVGPWTSYTGHKHIILPPGTNGRYIQIRFMKANGDSATVLQATVAEIDVYKKIAIPTEAVDPSLGFTTPLTNLTHLTPTDALACCYPNTGSGPDKAFDGLSTIWDFGWGGSPLSDYVALYGSDVYTDRQFVSASVWDTFNTAINSAYAAANNPTPTNLQISNAAAALATADALFVPGTGTRPGSDPVNKSALTTAIANAVTARAGIYINAAPTGEYFVPLADWNTFNTAIAAAQTVATGLTTTATDVSQAVTDLGAAQGLFVPVPGVGGAGDVRAEVFALIDEINAYRLDKTEVQWNDGDATYVVPPAISVEWWYWNNLHWAIADNYKNVAKLTTSDSDLAGIKTTIETAWNRLKNESRGVGTASAEPVPTARALKDTPTTGLKAVLEAAEAARAGVYIATAATANQVPSSAFWVTEADWDAFHNILKADGRGNGWETYGESRASDADVTSSTTKIAAAKTAWDLVVKTPGTLPPPTTANAGDITNLKNAIVAAETKRANLDLSADSSAQLGSAAHKNALGGTPAHFITFKLGNTAVSDIYRVEFLPRNGNGDISQYEIWGSTTTEIGINPSTQGGDVVLLASNAAPVGTGAAGAYTNADKATWLTGNGWKYVLFSSLKTAKYIQIRILHD
ncbi:hypothetical protein AGMMS4952_25080 [Spirochaetia bacterium]|nr:hypothetical protein AGMMS4952_25080 [Spirochaetia bacterium]